MDFSILIQLLRFLATFRGTATVGCIVSGVAALTSCIGGLPAPAPAALYTADAPSPEQRYCAWYGDARAGVFYFGQSAFWSAMRANDDRPTADLDHAGPALIGRFDLVREQLLPPLDVTPPGNRSGVWDVLDHPNGRVYFTNYFGSAGYVDPATGAVRHFEAAGAGLNELALGPGGTILASRYGVRGGRDHSGSVVVLDPDGGVLAEYPLAAPAGFIAAPKTVAYDGLRGEIWLTTDLLPLGGDPGAGARHDTYVLDAGGAELRRIESPEIQFVAFGPDQTGYRAEVEEDKLWLRIMPPVADGSHSDGLRIPLEDAFAGDFDFVQDIKVSADGGAVVTRWSGWVHLVDVKGSIRSLRLAPLETPGIYYTAAVRGDRLCATHCSNVTIVCREVDSRP